MLSLSRASWHCPTPPSSSRAAGGWQWDSEKQTAPASAKRTPIRSEEVTLPLKMFFTYATAQNNLSVLVSASRPCILQHVVTNTLELMKLLWLQTAACRGLVCEHSWTAHWSPWGLHWSESISVTNEGLCYLYTFTKPVPWQKRCQKTHHSSANPRCQGANEGSANEHSQRLWSLGHANPLAAAPAFWSLRCFPGLTGTDGTSRSHGPSPAASFSHQRNGKNRNIIKNHWGELNGKSAKWVVAPFELKVKVLFDLLIYQS